MFQSSKSIKPAGTILIIAGLFLLLSRTLGFDLMFGASTWPLFIIVLGIGLLILASVDNIVGKPIATHEMIVTLTGFLLAYQDAENLYQSWAYALVLTGPFTFGLGWLFHGKMHGDEKSFSDRHKIVATSIPFFVAFAAVFELIFNMRGYGMSIDNPEGIILLTILIVICGALFLRGPKQNTPSFDGAPYAGADLVNAR